MLRMSGSASIKSIILGLWQPKMDPFWPKSQILTRYIEVLIAFGVKTNQNLILNGVLGVILGSKRGSFWTPFLDPLLTVSRSTYVLL